MKTPAQLIADALDKAMETADNGKPMSQAELARRSGVPQPTISRTLQGRTIPEVKTLSALIDVLGRSNVDLASSIDAMLPKRSARTLPGLDVLTVPVFPLRCPECGQVSHKSFIELEMNDRLPCTSCGIIFNINDQYGHGELKLFLESIGRSGFILRQQRKFD